MPSCARTIALDRSTVTNAPATTNSGTIREIEGMRALAVGVVLLYHAHFGFSGGYVGVDVFFVLSGFLITRLLQRERLGTGRISLADFYARRARRILPAATLVILTTLLLAHLLISPVRAHQTAIDAAWAGGFVANFHFAAMGADYLQATQAPSLLQHWWSLAVEEQFYLVWPSLLALAWRGSRSARAARAERRITTVGVAVSAVLGIASFVVGLRLTHTNAPWGYFATWSRGWELAAGALCTFLWARRDRLPLRAVGGWVGLATILYAVFRFDATTPFPGVAALAPVVGTMLVILSVGATGSPGVVLSVRPLQWVGGRSYGIYLWHWPLLMILFDRMPGAGAVWRAGTLGVAVVAAAMSFWVLENPIRHLPAFVRSAGLSLAMGAASVGLVYGGAAVVLHTTKDISFSTGFVAPTPPTATAPPATSPVTSESSESMGSTTSPGGTTVTTTSPLGAKFDLTGIVRVPGDTTTTVASPTWAEQLDAKIRGELQPMIAASAVQDLLPDNVTPPISQQRDDHPSIYSNCLLTFTQTTNPDCVFGDPNGTVTIALIGDSHAVQWFPGLERAAIDNHWKLIALAKRACPTANVSVMLGTTNPYRACDVWRQGALARLAASDAQLVIITSWRKGYKGNAGGSPFTISDAQWRQGLTESVTTLTSAGKQVLLLGDTPQARTHMNECMASHPTSMTRCVLDHDTAVDTNQNRLEDALAAQLGAHHYDTSAWFCANGRCPAVVGNMAVYLDTNHINNTYSVALAPYMTLLVKAVLHLPHS
jgi:peptidoglycan/LPS O-acetylase OafA/YrhL